MRFRKKNRIDEAYLVKESKKIKEEDIDEALNRKKELEAKMTKSGLLKKYLTLSKLMWKMLNDYRKGEYKNVPWMTLSAVAFTLLYIVNPMDLVPDFIPIVGYLDDLTILAIALNLVETDIKKYIEWKEKED